MDARQEHRIYELFRISIILKGVFALGEILGGVLVFLVPLQSVLDTVGNLTADELAEDPHDFLYTHLATWAHGLSVGGKTFAAWYLISHGIIKGILIFNLLRERLWSYPASLTVFAGFIIYQMYRWVHTHSPLLLVLTVFDLLVMWLIWHEWRVRSR